MAGTFSTGAVAQTWWDGPEVGIQGGYGWGTSSGSIVGAPAGTPGYSFAPDGGLGGGHVGYNWQWGTWVLGLEGDAEGGEVAGHQNNIALGRSSYSVASNLDFDASIRGKLGFAFDRVLLYGTGGVEFGDVTMHYRAPSGGTLVGSSSNFRTPVGPPAPGLRTRLRRIGKVTSNTAMRISAARTRQFRPAVPVSTVTTSSTTTWSAPC